MASATITPSRVLATASSRLSAWCGEVVDFTYKVVMTAVMLLAPAFTADGQGSGPQVRKTPSLPRSWANFCLL